MAHAFRQASLTLGSCRSLGQLRAKKETGNQPATPGGAWRFQEGKGGRGRKA